jgi:opacity protein-like surface antigen
MNNMKKTFVITCAVVAITIGTLTVSSAAPMPTSNMGREYFLSVPDLKLWSCGLSFESLDRKLKPLTYGGPTGKISSSKTLGYVGYDFVPWFTGYATAGVGDTKIGHASQTGENSPQFGLGVHFNAIDKEILDPTLYEDRIRVTAGLQYIGSTAKDPATQDNIRLGDLSASAIVSLVNDIEGSKEFLPNSIAIFGGLLYADIITNDKNLKPDTKIGFTGGLELYYTESVSLVFALERLDDSGILAGVNVRF